MQSQITSLTQTLNQQTSWVIATQITPYRSSFSNDYRIAAFVNFGSIPYSGYPCVSWVSSNRISFNVQVYDGNVTAPIVSSGVYNVPVGGFNATPNAWFQCYIYYSVNRPNVWSGPDSGGQDLQHYVLVLASFNHGLDFVGLWRNNRAKLLCALSANSFILH